MHDEFHHRIYVDDTQKILLPQGDTFHFSVAFLFGMVAESQYDRLNCSTNVQIVEVCINTHKSMPF